MHADERRRVLWFVAVGATAAAVHWSIVVALVEHGHWAPLAANVCGWALALGVSLIGHHRLSFRGHGLPWWLPARRFAAISAGGFAVNEAAYAWLLRRSGTRYDLALALVLVAVALLTWLLSRHWAFLRT